MLGKGWRMRSLQGRISPLVVGVLLVLGACGPPFRRPEVRFESVRLGSLGLGGGTLYARFNLRNPNGYALESSGFTYAVELHDSVAAAAGNAEWVPLAEGSYDQTVRIAGKDSTVVELPIAFTFSGLSGALLSLMSRGTFDYRLSGTVALVSPLHRSIPYRHAGAVSLEGVR